MIGSPRKFANTIQDHTKRAAAKLTAASCTCRAQGPVGVQRINLHLGGIGDDIRLERMMQKKTGPWSHRNTDAPRAGLLEILTHCVRIAASRTRCTAGTKRPIRMPMIAMTTSSSMRVKARRGVIGAGSREIGIMRF